MRGETERQATLMVGLTPEGFVPQPPAAPDQASGRFIAAADVTHGRECGGRSRDAGLPLHYGRRRTSGDRHPELHGALSTSDGEQNAVAVAATIHFMKRDEPIKPENS